MNFQIVPDSFVIRSMVYRIFVCCKVSPIHDLYEFNGWTMSCCCSLSIFSMLHISKCKADFCWVDHTFYSFMCSHVCVQCSRRTQQCVTVPTDICDVPAPVCTLPRFCNLLSMGNLFLIKSLIKLALVLKIKALFPVQIMKWIHFFVWQMWLVSWCHHITATNYTMQL